MKKLSLSLLATSILSTAAHAAAPAAPGIYFYPSKAWTVGHAAEHSTTCAVQSEFNNGFVLQFDGSNKGVQSFTTNFRQNIFTEGQQYNVTLNVPGKASKSFQATATSPMMLTVPLAADADIYQAARDTAAIDISVDQNNFRFYLVNFAPAAANFEKCMAGGEIQTAPQPAQQKDASASPAPAAQPAPDALAVKNEAIAMEEKEAANTVPVTEINTTNAQPTIKEIPYTEKVKLGDQVVTKQEAKKLDAETAPQQQAELKQPEYRKRMSELLAEEIAKNPALASSEEEPFDPQQKASKAVETANSEASANAAAPSFVNERPGKEPATTQPADNVIAPTIEEPQANAGAVKAEPLSDVPPPEAMSMAAQRPVKEQPEEMEILASEATLPGEIVPPPPSEMIAKNAKEPVPQETKSRDAMLRQQAIEQTRGQQQSNAKPEATVTMPAKQAMNIPEPGRPIVHKQTAKVEADFTDLDNMEPASQTNGDEPFSQFGNNNTAMNEPTPAPAAARHTADPEMLSKLSELEKQVQDLKQENLALNEELKTNVSSAQEERTSISSENWNLERATMRFNESERQVKALGQQIQRERAQCAADKKDIEAQLFDPQITDQQQLARLADLEQKLADAQQQLADQKMRYEERIKMMQSQSATQ